MGRYAAVCIAVTLLLAGCVGGQGGTTTTTAPGGVETTTTAGTTADSGATGGANAPASVGSASAMNFYVSDEKNAMGDFAHLNVTVSKVGLKETGGNWTTHSGTARKPTPLGVGGSA